MNDNNTEDTPTTKETIAPIKVIYCPTCGLPAEYCEFGPTFDQCKVWIEKNCPQLYPNLFGGEQTNNESSNQTEQPAKPAEPEVKKLPGGKVKVKERPVVRVSLNQRKSRKWITTVSGVEKFGIKLSDASKVFSKTYSCGASVVKSTSGEDEIDIQGDVVHVEHVEQLIDLLKTKWQIPASDIILEDAKGKKK